MTSDTSNLDELYRQVTEYFDTVTDINVTPGAGSPPDKYIVTYRVKGACRETDGEVFIAEEHKVSVNLPFGFPHFPPSCAPLSPTFHPDFDSTAIRIGDTWEQNKSLIELIIHIGRMIAGEIFSSSGAFNDDAARWYRENKSQLPFAHTDFKQIAAATISQPSEYSRDPISRAEDTLQLESEGDIAPGKAPEIDPKTPESATDQPQEHHISDDSNDHGQEKESGPVRATDERRFYEEGNHPRYSRITIALLVTGLTALAGTLAFSYIFLTSGLGKAETEYKTCKTLLDKGRFSEAEQACRQALSFLDNVKLVRQDDKNSLKGKISNLLATDRMVHGLKGEVEYEGSYISINDRDLIMAFHKEMENGDLAFARERWHEAAQSYEAALAVSRELTTLNTKLMTDTKEKLAQSQFNGLKWAADKALANKNWKGAAYKLSETLTLAENAPNVSPSDIRKLRQLQAESNLKALLAQAQSDYDNDRWDEALRGYEMALKSSDIIEPDDILDIKRNIVRAKVYTAIENGKNAFTESRWDYVINQYEKALTLLKENAELLGTASSETSGEQLSRFMLHAAVIQDKQDLAKFQKARDYRHALEKLREIRKTITDSKFRNRTEFRSILNEVAIQEEKTANNQKIETLSKYLVTNFEDFFIRHYPPASGSQLTNPKIDFLEKQGDKLIFRMQCTENTGGRPVRLQMNYIYNPDDNSWQLLSE